MNAPLWVWVAGLVLLILGLGAFWVLRRIQRALFRLISVLMLAGFFIAGLAATYWLLQG